jgi:hypothetical protein
MAKVTIKGGSPGALERIAKSDVLGDQLEDIAKPVLEAAQQDPNEFYVSTLRMQRFVSGGKRGRVSIQIGAGPTIGGRVEALRGTLQRALGKAGL